MSYTLRGRAETRLAALVPVLLGACVLAGALHRWWPVELVALMGAVGLFLDVEVWNRLLPYQPAWATLPLGAVELGVLMAIVYGFGLHAPLWPAIALFATGWLTAVFLAQDCVVFRRSGRRGRGEELAEPVGDAHRRGAYAMIGM